MLLAFVAFAASASAISFDPGAICADVNLTNLPDASTMLVGKHLILGEAGEWPPFAQRDSTTASGWSGLDVDLVELLAAKLSFTYEIVDLPFPDDESWDEFFLRNMASDANAHVLLQYWFRKPNRLAFVDILSTHVDTSTVLVARVQPAQPLPWSELLIKFMRPYTFPLWGALIGLVLVSGAVDYLLERNREGARFGASIYEYTAGALWGGWDAPRSNMSAVYQVVVSFILLVSVAAYTANLAAFLTVSASPEESVKDIKTLVFDEKPACIAADSAMLPVFEAVLPQLHMTLDYGEDDILEELAHGNGDGYGCDGALVARDLLDIAKLDAAVCRLKVVETLKTAKTGWAVHRQAPCVGAALDWAFSASSASGAVDRLTQKWMKPASCSAKADKAAAAAATRRRLGSPSASTGSSKPRRWLTSAAAVGGAAGGGAAIAAEEEAKPGESIYDSVGIMGISDFIGIFVLWGIVTLLMLLLNAIKAGREKQARKPVAALHDQGRRQQCPSGADEASEGYRESMPRDASVTAVYA